MNDHLSEQIRRIYEDVEKGAVGEALDRVIATKTEMVKDQVDRITRELAEIRQLTPFKVELYTIDNEELIDQYIADSLSLIEFLVMVQKGVRMARRPHR